MENVKQIEIKEGMSVKELVQEMQKCGVIGAGRIGKAAEIFEEMLKNKWGRIINISSIFGIVARGKQTMYSATKHAINGVTKTLALELGPHNILVNSVCPGFTNTDLVKRNPPEKNALIAKDIPLGRFAEPSEIAELVLFLISDKNTYVNGQSLVIDGGFTCR